MRAMPAPPPIPTPPPPKAPARSYILLDFASSQVLAASNEHERVEPASLTKIMTAYAVFDALRAGSLQLTDLATISEHAWRAGGATTDGSTSFLPVHSQAPVEVLLRGMIVQSGNDASIALAERVAGSEEAFAQLLNAYAQRLGMTQSHFKNATGLPAPDQYVTAHDVALLSAAIVRDFPQHYHFFSEREYTFNGITQHNRNGLLGRDSSVDGLKTGHTAKAGYCLATSAKRGDMRLVAVVMGAASVRAREDANAALLNYGFNFFESKQLYAAGQSLSRVRVWQGAQNELALGVNRTFAVATPRGRFAQLQVNVQAPAAVVAPVSKDAPLGAVTISLDGKTLASEPLHALNDVAQAGFLGRTFDALLMKLE